MINLVPGKAQLYDIPLVLHAVSPQMFARYSIQKEKICYSIFTLCVQKKRYWKAIIQDVSLLSDETYTGDTRGKILHQHAQTSVL